MNPILSFLKPQLIHEVHPDEQVIYLYFYKLIFVYLLQILDM